MRLKLLIGCLITACWLPVGATYAQDLAQAQVQVGVGDENAGMMFYWRFGSDYYPWQYHHDPPPPPRGHAPPPPPPQHWSPPPPPPREHKPPKRPKKWNHGHDHDWDDDWDD